MEDTPIFSNTCGILYDDKVVFAFDNGQKEIPLSKIKSAVFRQRITNGFLLLILLPLPGYAVLDYMRNFYGLSRFMGYGVAIVISGMAYYYAKKKYHISLEMVSGSQFTIRVSENNRKDASRFIENLNREISK